MSRAFGESVVGDAALTWLDAPGYAPSMCSATTPCAPSRQELVMVKPLA